MATLTTKETGGLAPLVTNASFSPPEAAIAPEQLGAFLDGTGLNGPFMADLLSSFLMHEQCGLHLYRTAISMTLDPRLREKYEEFGAETEEHIRIFEELIAACGGQPGYVSPTARLTEALDSKIHEAAILLPDGRTRRPSSWPSSRPSSSPKRNAIPTGRSSRSSRRRSRRAVPGRHSRPQSTRSKSRRTSTS